MNLFNIFKTEKANIPKPEDFEKSRTYDYSTPESRVVTAEWLFSQAKIERSPKEQDWEKQNDYYEGRHDVAKELAEAVDAMEMPFVPSGIPDPYVMVESQIDPDVPMPEFHGRDNDLDGAKAEKRQKAVKFVIENNRINDMNTANERRLRKHGDAFWKAYWDEDMPCGTDKGDIRLKDIPLQDIYPDPTTKNLQDGEYVDYVYTMHKLKFYREYYDILKEKNIVLDDVMKAQYKVNDGLLDSSNPQSSRAKDDLVQILEHWYKQPYDTDGAKAGDIACTIQAGGYELKYIPCYWENTSKQNHLFPFVHYWCIHDETGFWNRSEIDPIMGLVDNADRELAIGILNDAMMANDIIIEEDGALMPGEEFTNLPGSKVTVRQGKINSVARLGGITNGVNTTPMVEWLLNQIQRTNRNWDTNNGQETSKVTTASGLLQLRSDAAQQSELKKADRNKGFARLYELIDWLCLEFYTDERMLFIGVDENDPDADPTRDSMLKYNTLEFAQTDVSMFNPVTGELMVDTKDLYYPRVDVTVTTGEGISKNPASTVQILDKLAATNVTQDNWQLLAAELDYLDIPQKQAIVDEWEKKFTSNVSPELIEALNQNPDVLEAVQEMLGVQNTQQPLQTGGETSEIGVEELTDTGMPEVNTY